MLLGKRASKLPVFVKNVNSTELRISFTCPFSLEQVSKIKTIKGRRWYPIDRYWAVPFTEETVKYLICVFAEEEVIFDLAKLPKDGNFTEAVLTCNSENVCLDSWDSQTQGLGDLLNNTSANKSEVGKYSDLIGPCNNELSNGTEITKGSLLAKSDRATELLLLVRKELVLHGYSDNTIQAYVGQICRYQVFLK